MFIMNSLFGIQKVKVFRKPKQKHGIIGAPFCKAILINPNLEFRYSTHSLSLFMRVTSCTPPGHSTGLLPLSNMLNRLFLSALLAHTQE